MRVRTLLFGSLAAIATLSACTDSTDYGGEGDGFTLRGPIVAVGERSIKISPQVIVDANGDATGWFAEGKVTQVHNNYEDDGCDIHEVGNVILDRAGHTEELDDLKKGEWVEVDGRIRDSKTSCSDSPFWDQRPVFDEVRELLR